MSTPRPPAAAAVRCAFASRWTPLRPLHAHATRNDVRLCVLMYADLYIYIYIHIYHAGDAGMRRCARLNETRTRDGVRGRSGRAPAHCGFARRLAWLGIRRWVAPWAAPPPWLRRLERREPCGALTPVAAAPNPIAPAAANAEQRSSARAQANRRSGPAAHNLILATTSALACSAALRCVALRLRLAEGAR